MRFFNVSIILATVFWTGRFFKDMGIVLGIDVGGSTTKVIGMKEKELVGTLQVRAADQITSLFGAVGNFLRGYGAKLSDV